MPFSTRPGLVTGDTPEVLAEIYRDDVNLAVWQNHASPSILNEAKLLLATGAVINQRAMLSSSIVHQKILDTLPTLADYPHLSSDICLLVDMFTCLFELTSVGLRLTSPAGAMCPKFHVDHVPCRLITTYAGPATEWLPDDCVDRNRLGVAGWNNEESGLLTKADAVQQLLPGDVALLKGESWEGNEKRGVVHRSPLIDRDGERLLLTLDFS